MIAIPIPTWAIVSMKIQRISVIGILTRLRAIIPTSIYSILETTVNLSTTYENQHYDFLVRSGYIHLEVGVLRVNGMNGTQRSSPAAAYNGPTGVGAPSIATFEFNMETVYPTHALIDRWYGLPLRCLAL